MTSLLCILIKIYSKLKIYKFLLSKFQNDSQAHLIFLIQTSQEKLIYLFSFFFLLTKGETLAAGVIVGLGGENELNKDPTLSNTEQAAPIPEFEDTSDFDSPSSGEFY